MASAPRLPKLRLAELGGFLRELVAERLGLPLALGGLLAGLEFLRADTGLCLRDRLERGADLLRRSEIGHAHALEPDAQPERGQAARQHGPSPTPAAPHSP